MQGSRRNPLDLRRPGRVFASVAVSILVVDQIAKAAVRASIAEGRTIQLLPGVLDLTYVHNVGAAFGLFPGRQPVFIATSCFVLFVVAAYWRRAHPREWPVVVGLAMVSAGALGNLIDRVVRGQVTDFFEFAFVQFPVFNISDMGILGGVFVLALWILFPPAGAELPAEDIVPPPDAPGDAAVPLAGEPGDAGASS